VFTVVAQEGSEKSPVPAVGSLLDELVRNGALQMLAAALQAEVAAYIGQFADVLDEDGHRMVVRNGYHEQRDVATRAGAVTVTAPRVIGVRADGRKELVALTDGYRESTESWAGLLRDAKRRGMRAPVLAMGDSTLGFWAALRDVFPTTREQRCWFHKSENVLAALPKSAHPGVIKAMQEIYNAQDNDHARVAVKAFKIDYGTKFPKAVEKITCDLDVLLEFDTQVKELRRIMGSGAGFVRADRGDRDRTIHQPTAPPRVSQLAQDVDDPVANRVTPPTTRGSPPSSSTARPGKHSTGTSRHNASIS